MTLEWVFVSYCIIFDSFSYFPRGKDIVANLSFLPSFMYWTTSQIFVLYMSSKSVVIEVSWFKFSEGHCRRVQGHKVQGQWGSWLKGSWSVRVMSRGIKVSGFKVSIFKVSELKVPDSTYTCRFIFSSIVWECLFLLYLEWY